MRKACLCLKTFCLVWVVAQSEHNPAVSSCLIPRGDSAITTLPLRNVTRVSTQAASFPASCSAWGCIQTELSWGTYAYASIPVLQRKPSCLERHQSEVWTPPGTTRTHQNIGSSDAWAAKALSMTQPWAGTRSKNNGDNIVWVMLSEFRNYVSFLFFRDWAETYLPLLWHPMPNANR